MIKIITKEDVEKTNSPYGMFDKYIGKHVMAGGELKYVDGEIVNITIEMYEQ